MAEWLKEVEKQAGVSEAEQLAAAERVFDWTIRNIQLDALPPPPKGPVATAGANTNPVTPAELGQPGPGYRHMPLELLVQGHGDAWERARVFILLCRQLNIDVVMLGLLEEGSPAPRGWLPAVLVKGELYLFDTSLGLPIPGPQGQGIATLAQVVADPKLLRQLDIEGEPPYPVAEADLKVVALIDAEPDALSRRMQLLQAALPAEQRLVLSTRLRILEPKLRQCQGIGQVSLWRVPLEAVLYTIGRSIVASQDPVVAKEVYLEVNSLNPNLPLAQGRNLHLQGQFENQDQAPGARSMYLRSRMPDQSINAIESSEIVRKAMGIDQQLPQDEQQKKAEIAIRTELVRTTKHHATYWLGLTYHEAGNNPAAIEWLATRTMEAFPPSPWIPGARYNLARCYEDFGNIDLALAAGAKKDKNTELARSLEAKAQSSFAAARKWLESDKDSPQRHGNLLRAKWIAERHPGDATKPIAPQENTTDASMP